MPGTLTKNLLLGLAAGVAGTVAMDAFLRGAQKLAPPAKPKPSDEEQSTEQVARAVLKRVGVPQPRPETLHTAGQVVHWGYGSSWGVIAGASRAAGLPLDWGGGQLLGLALWAGGDLWMLYRLGFARHPREYPAALHAKALAAHLVYGLGVWATLEGLARLAERRRFRPRPALHRVA